MRKDLSQINYHSLLFIAFMLIAWQIASNKSLIDTFHFSSPLAIVKDLVGLFANGEIWPHIFITFGVSFLGLIYGTVAGILVAFLFGNFKILAKIFDPILVGLYGLPKLALGPLIIIWFGIGIKAKIFMSLLMVFFLVFFNAYAGFKDTAADLINTLRMMGASKIQIISKVTLPSCIPWIVTSLRTGAGAAVMGTIVGEYLGSSKGMGWMIQAAGGVYNITRVLSCIAILFIIMSFIDLLLRQMEARVLVWRQEV